MSVSSREDVPVSRRRRSRVLISERAAYESPHRQTGAQSGRGLAHAMYPTHLPATASLHKVRYSDRIVWWVGIHGVLLAASAPEPCELFVLEPRHSLCARFLWIEWSEKGSTTQKMHAEVWTTALLANEARTPVGRPKFNRGKDSGQGLFPRIVLSYD